MMVQVLFPLGLSGSLSYSVPEAMGPLIKPGVQVTAPIARRNEVGVVTDITAATDPSEEKTLKEIVRVEESLPVITPQALALWQQIGAYYLTPIGVVAKMALPSWRFKRRSAGTVLEAPAPLVPGKPIVFQAHNPIDFYHRQLLEQIVAGRQCLLLCASAGACDLLYDRLSARLQIPVYCYHSQRSLKELNAARKDLYAGVPCAVIGMQRALFLPFTRAGLVMVDKEQEPAHKITDSAPRMHTTEAALFFAQIYGAQVILNCETLSLETLYNIEQQKFVREGGPSPARRITVENPYKTAEYIKQLQQQGKTVWEYDPATCRPAQLYGLESGTADAVVIHRSEELLSKKGFRATELAWRLIDYASYLCPLVIVETTDRNDNFFRAAEQLFPLSFANQLLQERQQYHYPPYTRLIALTLRHRSQSAARDAAAQWQELLENQHFPFEIFGPYPVNEAGSLLFSEQFLLSLPRNINSRTVKERLELLMHRMPGGPGQIQVDVDPL